LREHITPPLVECPRCGYDLSGVAAAGAITAVTHDTVKGRCSECGLEFVWGDVFNPWRNLIPGFIEHVGGARPQLVRSAFRTAWLALRPWRFWRLVRLETPVRSDRVVLWLAIAVVGVWAVCGGLSTALGVVSLWVMQYQPGWHVYAEPVTLGVVEPQWGSTMELRVARGGVWILAGIAASLMAGLMVLLLPDTRRRAKLRGVHVARGAAYGLAWLVAVLVVRGLWYVLSFGLSIATSYQMAPARRALYTGPSGLSLVSRWVGDVGEVFNEGWWLLAIATLAWVLVWWRSALREGWRVEEPGKVWFAVAVPACLAFVAVLLYSSLGAQLFL